MLICCHHIPEPTLSISDFADVANIIVAIVNLCLAYYIFVYQKDKDRAEKTDNARLQEQTIRLQWFKELIIQPHLGDINTFYKELHTIQGRISSNQLSEQERIDIVNFMKAEQAKLRKSFVDLLKGVDQNLYNYVKTNLDNLTDSITEILINDGFNLTHVETFDREIGAKIVYSRNDLISKIYNYKGV